MCSTAWRGLCFSCDGMQVAQAAGGAVGTAVALRWVPHDWQGRFRTFDQGPKPGVSLALGAACECILSFAINLVVLWSAHTRCAAMRDLSTCAALRACVHAVCVCSRFMWFYEAICLPNGTGTGMVCNRVCRLHASNCQAMCMGHAPGRLCCVSTDCCRSQPFAHKRITYRLHAAQAQAPGLHCSTSCDRAAGAPACQSMRSASLR